MADISSWFRGRIAHWSRSVPNFRGKQRVIRAVDHPFVVPRAVDFRHASGARFRLEGFDLIEESLLYRGEYGADVRATLRGLYALGAKTFWDVGANIGSVSLPLLRECSGLAATLFEPAPGVLMKLASNLGLNPDLAERAQLLGIALGHASGPGMFHLSSVVGNSGVAGIGSSINRVGLGIGVWTLTGDDVIAHGMAQPPELLKLDVEGFELEVLHGLTRHLKNAKDVAVVFEHSPYRLQERQRPLDAVTSWLQDGGFELRPLNARGPHALTSELLESHTDVVALKGKYRAFGE